VVVDNLQEEVEEALALLVKMHLVVPQVVMVVQAQRHPFQVLLSHELVEAAAGLISSAVQAMRVQAGQAVEETEAGIT
jgi:hypothetical protein